MFSVIYYQLFRTRLFRIRLYFELIVLFLHLKSIPLFRTCQKQSTYKRAQLETYCASLTCSVRLRISSCYYWAACASSLSVVCGEKRPSGGGKTRRSGTEKRCSHKWFHMIFSCTNPCTDTFCTSSALPLKNPQSVANLKKATCVVRSDSIMGVTL